MQVKLRSVENARAIPERLETCSRRGATQMHVYLYLYLTTYLKQAIDRLDLEVELDTHPYSEFPPIQHKIDRI